MVLVPLSGHEKANLPVIDSNQAEKIQSQGTAADSPGES